MVLTKGFIDKETEQKIRDAAILEEVIADDVILTKRGREMEGKCPFCHSEKKLKIPLEKNLYKCHVCGEGGNHAVKYVMRRKNLNYNEALHYLADRFNVEIPKPEKKKKKQSRGNRQLSFRDAQLRESGITDKMQTYELSQGPDTASIENRYRKGTVDKRDWSVTNGDDMILTYLDLNGKPMRFEYNKKMRDYFRVRYQHPHLHPSKDGKPMKYGSPFGSKPMLWFSMLIIQAFKTKQIIETLYIVEGEKKADAMCAAGLMTVGISGIHNFSTGGEMPHQFEMLIKTCGIKNIVFVQDADWQELKIKDVTTPVERRPHLFYLSARKYQQYFKNYYYSGYELDIFFAYGKDTQYKGMDDLIVKGLKKKGEELKEDFEAARKDKEGKGKHVDVLNITDYSDHKLKSLWNLESMPKFFQEHKEQLMKLREFRFKSLKYRYNKESGEFELAQKILPHEEFWHEVINEKTGKSSFKFNYVGILEFLRNRGYGIYKTDDTNFIFVHIENKIVREVHPNEIKRYVLDFTRSLTDWHKNQILEMLLRGGDQYLGPAKLANMFYFEPEFNRATKEAMYLYFKTKYWRITKDGITEHPITDIPLNIWDDKIIDFDPKLADKPYIQIKRVGDSWKTQTSKDAKEADIANFYANTSNFHWKKYMELGEEEGRKVWVERETPEEVTKSDQQIWKANLIAKMCATGYLLHDFTDYGNMKAIIAMDGLESEVGKSQGGTGKGIYCTTFERMVPTHWVDGKRKNLDDDKHIFGGVDERTQIIYFEDVRVNFDFERLFPTITKGTWVEKKGVDGHREDPKKVLIDTNHALNGDGNSHARRKFHISFSDYYNGFRSVRDEFGHNFYTEWGFEQWNHFYNFMANCMQTYLQYGLAYSIPTKALERRKLRQSVGENFLAWANLQFHTTLDADENKGRFLNHRIRADWLFEQYIAEANGRDKRYLDKRGFKKKLKGFCSYAGLDWNPTRSGKEDDRIISNGKEYFLLADKDFDINEMRTVSNDNDANALASAKEEAAF